MCSTVFVSGIFKETNLSQKDVNSDGRNFSFKEKGWYFAKTWYKKNNKCKPIIYCCTHVDNYLRKGNESKSQNSAPHDFQRGFQKTKGLRGYLVQFIGLVQNTGIHELIWKLLPWDGCHFPQKCSNQWFFQWWLLHWMVFFVRIYLDINAWGLFLLLVYWSSLKICPFFIRIFTYFLC